MIIVVIVDTLEWVKDSYRTKYIFLPPDNYLLPHYTQQIDRNIRKQKGRMIVDNIHCLVETKHTSAIVINSLMNLVFLSYQHETPKKFQICYMYMKSRQDNLEKRISFHYDELFNIVNE